MGRSNADLLAGITAGGSVTAYHVSPKANRASIERNGLIPGAPTVDSNKRTPNAGVFGSVKPKGVERYADAADDRNPFDENGNWSPPEGPHNGGDVWEFKVPATNVSIDTWTAPKGSAVKHAGVIPPQSLTRVGHVTGNNEVHWHKEEECHG
jgi:hypothetical protein